MRFLGNAYFCIRIIGDTNLKQMIITIKTIITLTKTIMRKLLSVQLLLLMCSIGIKAANTVALPSGSILFSDADLVNCNAENEGVNVGSTRSNSSMTFALQNDTKQDYILSLKSGAKNLTAVYNITITDNNSGDVVLNDDFNVSNTGNWTPVEYHGMMIPAMPTGSYTMVISVKSTTGSYAGNLGGLSIETIDDFGLIPGVLELSKGTYVGPKTEGENVGYVRNGGTAAYQFMNNNDGYYTFSLGLTRYNDAVIGISITDSNTGAEEYSGSYEIPADANNYAVKTVAEGCRITRGIKTVTLTFSGEPDIFLCNYKTPTFALTGVALTVSDAKWATFSSTNPLDFSAVEGLKAYTATNNNGTIQYSAVSGAVPANTGILVSAEAGVYNIPVAEAAPAPVVNDFVGTADGEAVSDGTYYALANKSNGIGLYPVASGVAIPVNKAYIVVASQAKPFYGFAGEVTAIGALEHAAPGIEASVVFNLAGQKVDKSYKGIVIINGKKHLNK
jgi:hypothetical protein